MIATVKEERGQLTLNWHVDPVRRRLLERTRLGGRVLCTDHHVWSTGRIVYAFRDRWNVEKLFRRAKKGGGRILGAFAPWADNFLALAYLRDGDRLDAGKPRPPDAGKPEVSQRHNENTGGEPLWSVWARKGLADLRP